MKKKGLAMLLTVGLLCLTAGAVAEISTNLRKETVYTTKRKVETQSFVNRDGEIVVAEDLGYATVHNQYTTGTKLSRTDYYDAEGNLVNNSQGFASRVLDYSMNNISLEYFLNAEGYPVAGPGGYARMETDWYSGKRHLESRYYDTEGNLFSSGTQYARMTTVYPEDDASKWTKPTSVTYYDENDNLMRGPNGYARVEYEYGPAGSGVSKTTYLDENGNLYYYQKAGYAVMERTYKNGRFVKDAYYGADGELCAGPKGYAYVELEYDNGENKPTREAYFDAQGQPYRMAGGYYILTRKYAQKSRVTEEAYYDAEGNPTLCNDGYHQIRTTYRTDGKITQRFYVGLDGKWMVHPTLGYASYGNEYDGKRISRTTYYDENKKPMDCAEGYAKVEYLYKDKKPTETRYFHADGSLAIGPDGYARVVYTTDKDGNILTEVYYGADGEPGCNSEGVFEAHYTYEGTRKSSEAYFRDGEPAVTEDGVHMIRYEYNGDGKVTREAYLGMEEQPVLCADGYAVRETEYLSNGKVAANRYYDEKNQLVLTPGKTYAYQLTEYSEDGDSYTLTQYDTENQAIQVDGYFAQICTLDEAGRVIRTAYLDENDAPTVNSKGIAATENVYNEAGQVVRVQYLDLRDELMLCADGYAIVQREYDTYGNVDEERYLGTDGAPVLRNGGYAMLRRVYQAKGRMTEVGYYGLDGQMVLNSSGIARETRELDVFGNVIRTLYFGVDGEPVANTSGYAEIRRVFNDKKQTIHEEWYGADGQPVNVKGDLYFQIDREFDEMGNTAVERYLDENGQPMACKAGYEEVRRVYIAKDLAREVTYYSGGNPQADTNGVSMIIREFDDKGLVIKEAYFGVNREPVAHAKNKYHRIDRTWLDSKHATSEAWFDVNDQPMTLGDTYVRRDREYDEALNVAVEKYFDAAGNPIACKAGYDEYRRVYNEDHLAV
ncbi:MAG: hypothetical protein IKE24_06975, partial [Clostridia bacterium]|nr:hypothetical protein [Clostridia bacterium]